MARSLGEAFVDIRPSTLGFPAALRAKLKAALAGITGEVPIGADTTKLDIALTAARAKAAALEAATSSLRLDANAKALTAKIAGLQAQASHLADAMANMELDVDIRAASTKILALAAEVRALESQEHQFKIDFDTQLLFAQLRAADAAVDELVKTRDMTVEVKVDTSPLKKAAALVQAIFFPGKGGGGGGGGPPGGGGRGGILGGAFFGFNALIGASILGVKLWHVALSAALETLIVAVSATAAAAVGIAAMAPAAKDVLTQMKAIDTVNETMGQQIPSLSRQFDRLAQSLAPQVIEAYGGAVGLLAKNTGAFSSTAHQVATMVDNMVARLGLWAQTQGGLGTILQHGVNYLHQFGSILGNLGSAIVNLLKASPGTAHFLLDLVDGFAKVLNWVSKLPTPLLTLVLALHAVYTWGGFLLGVMTKMPGVFGLAARGVVTALDAIGAALGGISTAGVLTALIAIGFVAYKIYQAWTSTSPAVTKAINDVNSALAGLSASRAFFVLPVLVGNLNAQLRATSGQLSFSMKHFDGIGAVVLQTGSAFNSLKADLSGVVHGGFTSELKSLFNAGRDALNMFTAGPGNATSAIQRQKNDVAALNGEINRLLGSQRNLDAETSVLIRSNNTFGSGGQRLSQALALMSLAGVSVTDSFALMRQKVDNLISGYKAMSVQGGILNNSVNAITFASGLQASKVSDLNSAWDTFIATVTGSESGFANVETSILGMAAAAQSAGAHMTDSNGRVSSSFGQLTSTAGGTKGSFTGLNNTSLALQETFNQTVTSANTMLDALQVQATAAGLGQKGTDLLTQATKDLVTQMLPAASGSKTLTAELYALAQRGGYTGADSFKALSAWVGKTKNPMSSLQGIVETFTVKSAGLTQDVQNLSVALGTTLTQAMSQALFLASGGQKAFTDFATAVFSAGGNMAKVQPAAGTLISQLLKMTGSTRVAHDQFISFAEGALKLTRAQADALWKSFEQSHPALGTAGAEAASAKKQFVDFAVNGLHLSAAKAGALWDKLAHEKLIFAGGKADASRGKFIKWAAQIGISTQAAKDLWAMLAHQNLDSWLTGKINTSRKQFFIWTQQVGIAHDKASLFWAMLAQQKFDFLSGKATDNLHHFEKLAGQFGINTSQAGILWGELRKQELERTAKHADHARGSMDLLHQKVADLGPWQRLNGYLRGSVAHALSGVAGGIGGVSGVYDSAAKVLGVATIKTSNLAAANIIKFFSGFAGGGQVPGGFMPGKDIIPAMLSPGEFVLNPRAAKAIGYGNLEAVNSGIPTHGGVQHLAAGGYANPLRGVRGLTPMRIDMGVDYGGAGPLYAVGPGSILNTVNSGWPGGAFISERLSTGPLAGDVIYAAEHIVPRVRPGQKVDASTIIGTLLSGYPFSEWGFATASGTGETAAAAAGQQSHGGDPGANTTAYGVAMSNFLQSLGAPGGIMMSHKITGTANLAGLASLGGGGFGASAAQTAAFDKAMKVMKSAEQFRMTGPFAEVLTAMVRRTGQSGAARLTAAYNALGGSGGIPGGVSSGGEMHNLVTIARYLMTQGASRAGAAGIAGTVAGESGGNPESVGSGGFGLIGWTGNTIGLPAGYHITGNAARDLAIQMAGIPGYARSRPGGWPDGFAQATDPVAAGNLWSRYEAPARALSDTRPGIAQQVYAALAGANAATVAGIGNAVGRAGFAHHAQGGLAGTLGRQQQQERRDFSALRGAIAGDLAHPDAWAKRNRVLIAGEMRTLTRGQQDEQGAFGRLAGRGLTTGSLSRFGAAARGELRTARDIALNIAEPQRGGHLKTILAALVHTAGLGLPKQPPGKPPPPTPDQLLADAQKKLLAYDLAAFRPTSLRLPGGFGYAGGGRVFDSGGWLPTGTSIVHNNTGHAERVTPPGGGQLTPGERAILAELRAIRHATQAAPQGYAQALAGSLARGANRGYYGG